MQKIKNNLKNQINLIFLLFGIFILLTTTAFIMEAMINFRPVSLSAKTKTLKMEVVFQNASPLFYFTNQSNIFLGLTFILVACFPNMQYRKMLFSATSIITITFLIYWTLIAFTSDWTKVYNSIVSLITHFLNPVLGFIGLWLIRKSVVVDNKLLFNTSLYVFVYFMFAFILYFSSYSYFKDEYKDGVVIYSFLNFTKPFFYKGGNIILIIFLDIFSFIAGIFIPISLSLFWKFTYKIKYDKNICYIKDLKRKLNRK
ncbi:MAGa3780 family membrane protein [Mesomycoplasma molare]|uniref:Uncharacterized protein n=1 Tax=Mesomycoplasma molare TaxID=171288 RepID=A0ABY5TV90_9BACT|nr:hypothetical protein [Mesomycoplasma molare]UWD34580.1 hypothetical protein NX772_01995 [Mesomycoplasma molare]